MVEFIEKVKVKKLGVLSVAKLQAVIMALVGLLLGILSVIMGAVLGSMFGGSASMLGSFGVIGIIVFPIVYAIIGFIGGAISALLYNLGAGWVGGIEMNLEQ